MQKRVIYNIKFAICAWTFETRLFYGKDGLVMIVESDNTWFDANFLLNFTIKKELYYIENDMT